MRRLRENNYILCGVLLFCCVMVIFGVYFVSNSQTVRGISEKNSISREDAKLAYDFLGQGQAVEDCLQTKNTYLTYSEYRDFLERLHLLSVIQFDWNAADTTYVLQDDFFLIRDQIENLFEQSGSDFDLLTQTASTDAAGAKLPDITGDTPVRVLILQNGKNVAKNIYFSADSKFQITWKAQTKNKKKNTKIHAKQLKLEVGESAVVSCDSGKLYLMDSKGGQTSLAYQGSFEITRYEDGYALVNVVPIEQYLYGVVQSEMPTYFEPQALRAQAVCARTYIVTRLLGDEIEEYHADVDDSVRYQVYNQIAMDDKIEQAVNETKGMILTKENLPINAFFFSTSFGQTSNNAIWNQDILPYLSSIRGNAKSQKAKDLSSEAAFEEFLKQKKKSDYDFDSPYYRWQANLDLEEKEQQLFAAIESMIRIGDERVSLVPEKTGEKTYYLYEYGKLKSVKVKKRAKSGAVMKLLLTFEHGKVTVTNENSIRKILGIFITSLSNEQEEQLPLTGMAPSVYAMISRTKEGTVLLGGGLGHGIGMSQYGANAMAKQGMDMETIVKTYYKDVEISELYK